MEIIRFVNPLVSILKKINQKRRLASLEHLELSLRYLTICGIEREIQQEIDLMDATSHSVNILASMN